MAVRLTDRKAFLTSNNCARVFAFSMQIMIVFTQNTWIVGFSLINVRY